MKSTEVKLLKSEEERLKERLAKSPTERFRLMLNLFKLNKKLKAANPTQH